MQIDETAEQSATKVYLIGGGIASLAAAAFFIRDADVPGRNIVVLEQLDRLGGSLDGAGSPENGYILRGGRMIESKYVCTYDLFSSIPTLEGGRTVTQEIFDWNQIMQTSSKCRLVRGGQRIDTPEYGLSEEHILGLERLAIEPEAMLGNSSIADQFRPSFFETNFWLMWCTTFAFQPWHSAVEFKRYLLRFTHMVAGFNQLHGIMRTVYNQYDSMVRPLQKWLAEREVRFELNVRVTDLIVREEGGQKTVDRIMYTRDGVSDEIHVGKDDYVVATLGSMTEASSVGSMDSVPVLNGKADGGAWKLWEKIAAGRPEFGHPCVFTDRIEQSKWISFTSTLRDRTFFRLLREFTGNLPGAGGLISFADSAWLASIVLPHQPHFIGQPEDVEVFWGYGLRVDKPGDFVKKPMSACTGREIMTEILGHLHIEREAAQIRRTSICIPCMMPFVTSQFLTRDKGDRPDVIPSGSRNLAFIGQFCEIPDDVVFTVEYSIRSAATAVYSLCGLDRDPPPVYKGQYDPRILLKAFKTLHEMTV